MLTEHAGITLGKASPLCRLLTWYQALTGFRTIDEHKLPLTKAEDVFRLIGKNATQKDKENKN